MRTNKRHLYLVSSITFTLYYALTIPMVGDCTTRTATIMNGQQVSPYVYRLLTPAILTAMGNTFAAQVVFLLVAFLLFFMLLDVWLRYWRAHPAGLLIVALMLPMTLQTWFCGQYEVTELVLLLCGLLLLTRRLLLLEHLTEK